MRTSLCASTAALALVAASAGLAPVGAADLNIAPIYKPPAAALPTWAGTYVGVAGGGAWGGAVVRNNATGADQTSHFDLAGGLFGVTTGINAEGGNGVLGLEADISATSKKGSTLEFPPNAAFSNEVREVAGSRPSAGASVMRAIIGSSTPRVAPRLPMSQTVLSLRQV